MHKFKSYFNEKVADKNSERVYNKLMDRQKELARAFAVIVDTGGKFDKGIEENGSHYLEPEDNISNFDQGIACGRCLFFDQKNSCSIVEGRIEQKASCRFWIIPAEEIK